MRKKIYIGTLVALFVLILFQIKIVTDSRKNEVVTFMSEWKKNGIPVSVVQLKKKNLPFYMKIGANRISPTHFEAYVSKDAISSIELGQDAIIKTNDESIKAVVAKKGTSVDIKNGLYQVTLKTDTPSNSISKFETIYAQIVTTVMPDVVSVPNESIVTADDKKYIFTVIGNVVKKSEIVNGDSNGVETIVDESLNNAMVVTHGISKIKDGQLVGIYNCTDCNK